jgi:hypothetical protein
VSPDADKSCSACSCIDETIEHAIATCPISREFWEMVSNRLLSRLLGGVEVDGLPGHGDSIDDLKKIVYFYPELRDRLNPDQLHVLTGTSIYIFLTS